MPRPGSAFRHSRYKLSRRNDVGCDRRSRSLHYGLRSLVVMAEVWVKEAQEAAALGMEMVGGTAMPIDRCSNSKEGICSRVSARALPRCSLQLFRRLGTSELHLSWSSAALLGHPGRRGGRNSVPQGMPRRPCGSFRRIGRPHDPREIDGRCSRSRVWLRPSFFVLQSCIMPCGFGGTSSTPSKNLKRWRGSSRMAA